MGCRGETETAEATLRRRKQHKRNKDLDSICVPSSAPVRSDLGSE